MIIQAELKCKQTGCEADTCAVDKVIELPSPRFRQFSRALLADYDFIAENKNAIQHDEDARHCSQAERCIGTLPRSTKPATSVWQSSFPIWQGRKM